MHLKTNKTIFITGANGFIGSALADFFSEKGYEVVALVRKMPTVKKPQLSYQIYALEQPSTILHLNENAVILHCAYTPKQASQNPLDWNIIAVTDLCRQSSETGAQLVFFSSIAVTSESDSYYAVQKRACEQLIASTTKAAILRPGLVLGKGGLFYKTVQSLRKTRFLPSIHGGKQPVYYVGITDLCSFTEQVVVENRTGILTCCHPKSIPYSEFYTTIARLLGFNIVVLPVPAFVLRFAAKFSQKYITPDNVKGLNLFPKPGKSADFPYQDLIACVKNL